jgi:YjbE family integral membrane protein
MPVNTKYVKGVWKMEFLHAEFFVMVGSVILVDVLLGGDNAVVIALTSRNLPVHQQKQAVLWGTVGAVIMRVALTIVAVRLLKIPFLKLIGGLLLIWIAIKLLTAEKEDQCDVAKADCLLAAIKTIIFADLVMSLDNVLALAAVTKGNIPLLLFGLALSIPLIMWGSKLILHLMERYPIIITLGAALLGYTAGEMIVADAHVGQVLHGGLELLHTGIPLITTVAVVLIGYIWKAKENIEKVE